MWASILEASLPCGGCGSNWLDADGHFYRTHWNLHRNRSFPHYHSNGISSFVGRTLGSFCYASFILLYILALARVAGSCPFTFRNLSTRYLVELSFTALQQLQKVPLHKPHLFLKWYSAYQVWFKSFDSYIDDMIACLLGTGYVVFIVSNVTTLKCYGMVPILVYLMFPLTSGFVFLIVYFSLPFGAHIVETCRKSIFQRRKHFLFQMDKVLYSLEVKIVKRKFTSLKLVTINYGGFYPVVRGAEADFYFYVLIRTADLLITIGNVG